MVGESDGVWVRLCRTTDMSDYCNVGLLMVMFRVWVRHFWTTDMSDYYNVGLLPHHQSKPIFVGLLRRRSILVGLLTRSD